MGDFYETFGDDATLTARALNIALTTRDKKEDPTPLAGFPHHALDQYLPRLVNAGHRVAIADQVEDPKLAKGIVRREITRIVTPGTLTATEQSNEEANNFIASVIPSKKKIGIALCDVSTGLIKITEIQSIPTLIDEISRINPSEILTAPGKDISMLSHFPIEVYEDYSYTYDESRDMLTTQFNVSSLAAFGILPYKDAIIAAGCLISYLKNTQKNDLGHIHTISYYDIYGNMVLDAATMRNLELVSSSGEQEKDNSLFSVLNHTQTTMGSRLLREWILHPLLDVKSIEQRQACVEYLFTNPDELSHTQEILKHISDLEHICGKIGLNRAHARDLVNLKESLIHSLDLCSSLSPDSPFSTYSSKLQKLRPHLSSLISTIDKSIADNPPHSVTEGHFIKDGYNKDIDTIRKETSSSRGWISALEDSERKKTGITSLKVRMNKVFGYYIEVTHTHKDKVPDNYIRKQTLVNCERYITPELKEKEELVFNAEETLSRLEYECFLDICREGLSAVKDIQIVAHIVAETDSLASLGYTARQNDYVKPLIRPYGAQNSSISIKNSRHPIVELHLGHEFTPNDLSIDFNTHRLMILTGPNMSGKSTYIRQAAILILMAQIGSFVPAQSAEISLVDRIFTRVGASDDLSAGRSTFMVEMDEASNILNNATQNSFIVLDEVGRGTSTYDGVSIAWAIAEHIHNTIGARCLFATHYHELLKLEDELDAVKNYNVTVHEENGDVLFLHKIEEGGTDRSYGIYVAHMAGLPSTLIDRAEEILNGFEQENMFGVRSDPSARKKSSSVGKKAEATPAATPQLSFIDESASGSIPNLFKELKDVDTNNMTPIQALQLLEKWKKRVGT